MDIVAALVAVLIPFAATYAFSGVKSVVTAIDRLPAIVQQILVVVEAYVFTLVAAKLGVPLPVDIHAWDLGIVTGILNGLAAIGIHAIRKN